MSAKTLKKMSKLVIYKASAGSGKTFTLTLEYLFILFENKFSFQHILAITFTNKASSEMKNRIIEQLYLLSTGEKTEYKQRIAERFQIDDEQIKTKAKEIINLILHNYSFFHVETIDKFFQGVVVNFAKELGIYSIQNIELNSKNVLEKTISHLFINIDSYPDLKIWLNEYVMNQIDKGENYDVRRNILNLCNDLFNESVASMITDSNIFFDDKKTIDSTYHKYEKIVSDFETSQRSIAEQAISLISKNGLEIDDFSYGTSGFANYFNKINNNDFEPTKRVLDALEGEKYWYNQKSTKKQEIVHVMEGGILSLLKQSIDIYHQQFSTYTTAQCILKYRYIFPVINKIATKVLDYCSDNNIHLLSNNNLLLKSIIDNNPAPFVYEKTGTYLHHFMLDEFQDTSKVQWNNIKPLVENSLAEDNKCLVVGDVKQSIYRWRNGDWTLLGSKIFEDFQGRTETFSLDTNYRSAPEIINFNNSLFEQCKTLLKNTIDSEINNSGITLPPYLQDVSNKAYNDISQKLNNKVEVNGYISLTFCDKKSYNDEVLGWLPRKIEELQDSGIRASEIAIIVRKNAECKKVIDCLLNYKNTCNSGKYCFDIISSEGLLLQNSSAVMIVISLLSVSINPVDSLSKAFVVQEYEMQYNGKNANEVCLEKSQFGDFIAKYSIDLNQNNSLYDKCEYFIQKLSLAIETELPFLKDFMDQVLDFTINNNGSVIAFLDWWNEKGKMVKISLPENQSSIQVTTIHKSKGLQFKAVILPFCNWEIVKYGSKLWINSQQIEFPFHPVDFNKNLANSSLSFDFHVEKFQQYIDNLNLLYVALTRAEEALVMMTSTTDSTELSTVANFLATLNTKKENCTIEWGQKNFSVYKEKSKINTVQCSFPTYGVSPAIVFATHEAEYFGLHDTHTPQQNWGIILHDILSKIETVNDVDNAVNDALNLGTINSNIASSIKNKLNKALSHPQAKNWFNGTYELLTEATIIKPNGDTKRPDRVLINGNEAIIVDYKFSKPSNFDTHKYQVIEYMSLFKEMDYNTSGYIWYVGNDEIRKVEIASI